MLTTEEGSKTPMDSKAVSAFESVLECPLCLNLFCEPISINCGHTFCRVCLVSSLRKHKKQCPLCRAACSIGAEDAKDASVNNVIKQMCIDLLPEKYQERLLEAEEVKMLWPKEYPIFFYNSVVFPGSSISLHLFEHRYKTMMHRIMNINASRTFAYVCSFSNSIAGEVAVLAEVEECEFLHDGRVLLEAKIKSRHIITDAYIEDGSEGLHYARLRDLQDEPVAEENKSEFQQLLQQGRALVSDMRDLGFLSQLQSVHGDEPRSPESFSLWLVSIAKTMKTPDKMALLKCTNTEERLRGVMESLANWVREEQLCKEQREAAGAADGPNSLNLPLPEGLTSQGLEQMVRELTGVVAGGASGDIGSSVTGTDESVVGHRRNRPNDDDDDGNV